MSDDKIEIDSSFWKKYVKKYWMYVPIYIVGAIVAITFSIIVGLWYMNISVIGGLGTWTFDQWSVGYAVIFMLVLMLFELLMVGLPTLGYMGGVTLLLWSRLPDEEKEELKSRRKKNKGAGRKMGGGGGGSFLLLIVSLVIILVEGNWFEPFGNLPYTYFVYVWLLACLWTSLVFGIPIAAMGIAYLVYIVLKTEDAP